MSYSVAGGGVAIALVGLVWIVLGLFTQTQYATWAGVGIFSLGFVMVGFATNEEDSEGYEWDDDE